MHRALLADAVENITALEQEEAFSPHHRRSKDAGIASTPTHAQPSSSSSWEDVAADVVPSSEASAPDARLQEETSSFVESGGLQRLSQRLHERMEDSDSEYLSAEDE